MKFTKITVATLAVVAFTLLSTGSAQATTITGQLWHVSEATANNAIVANVPGTTPDVTFDVVSSPGGLNFNATSATVAAWLATGGATSIVENTAGTLASLMDNGTRGTLLNFAGFVTVVSGQTFTVTHDDGLTLTIDAGTITPPVGPGPTPPATITVTYTGTAGNEPFQLVYGECCGGPAVLQVALPFSNQTAPVPEPATLSLLGLGLAGLATRLRRKL